MIGLKNFLGGIFRSVKVKGGKKYQNDRMDMSWRGMVMDMYGLQLDDNVEDIR